MGLFRSIKLRWLVARAESAAAKGDLARACERLEAALPLADGERKAAVLNRLGLLCYRRGDFERAARSCREATQYVGAPNATLHMNLANALDRLGRPEEALAEYERARDLAPDHAGVLFNLGVYKSGAGDPRGAVEVLRKALESMRAAPDRVPAGLTSENVATALVHACSAAGMRAEAEEELARVKLSDASRLNLRAMLASRTGDPDEALRLYREALEADPALASAHFNMGMAFLRKGEAARALEAFDRFARATPDDPVAEFGLGYAHESMEHAELARKHYDEFLRRARTYSGDAAWLEIARGFMDQAEKYLRQQN